ncbi:MAG: LPS assembly lipoprotein LptE [Candidatus Binataceae bacterium]
MFAATFAAACAMAGCGYHFAAQGDALPANARTIYVKLFSNGTRVTGINDEFMRYVKDEVADHDRLKLVDDPAQADLQLSGRIKYNNHLPLNFNSALEPTIYSEALSVSAALTDRRTHQVIWSTRSVSNTQHVPIVGQTVVATTPSFLQQNLRGGDIAQLPDVQTAQVESAATQDLVMRQVAKNLYAEMAEGF